MAVHWSEHFNYVHGIILEVTGCYLLITMIFISSEMDKKFLKPEKSYRYLLLAVVVTSFFLMSSRFVTDSRLIRKYPKRVKLYALGMAVLAASLFTAGYLLRNDYRNETLFSLKFKASLRSDVQKYPTDERVRGYMDQIQREERCCGAGGPEDWLWPEEKLPSTCCDHKGVCHQESVYLYRRGCAMLLYKKYHTLGLGFSIALYCISIYLAVAFVLLVLILAWFPERGGSFDKVKGKVN